MVRISWDIAGEINWVILYNMLLCKESLTGHAFQNGMKACTLLDERQVVSPFIASSRLKYRLSHTHLLQALFTNKIIKTQVSGMSFGEWNKIWCKDCYDLPHPPTLLFLWIKKAYFWWITIYHTIKFLSVKSPRPEGTTLFFFMVPPHPIKDHARRLQPQRQRAGGTVDARCHSAKPAFDIRKDALRHLGMVHDLVDQAIHGPIRQSNYSLSMLISCVLSHIIVNFQYFFK